MAKFLFTDLDNTLGKAICETPGVDPNCVSRIVIDLQVGKPGRIYLETYADDAVLNVEIPLTGVEVSEDDIPSGHP